MGSATLRLPQYKRRQLSEAVHSTVVVQGLTHAFYRHPARFSPLFARAAIEAFTKPGDLVIDPFAGGGTTLVEARVLARRSIGVDISSLSTFVARAKTTMLNGADHEAIRDWASGLLARKLNLRRRVARRHICADAGYQQNINDRHTWPIRKIIEIVLHEASSLSRPSQQQFVRCVLLRTAQWALDNRQHIPSATEFRGQLSTYLEEMLVGSREYSTAARKADRHYEHEGPSRVRILCRSAIGIDNLSTFANEKSPKLVLTSPPYPGVHVLYHRWQVQGRRETPAPFWIANRHDGHFGSHYTFGDRKQQGLKPYFDQAGQAFSSVRRLADANTIVVQLVAFSEPEWQVARYLKMMRESGFDEFTIPELANSSDGRVWRAVPNRKWYARQRGKTSASKELVLFHRPR